MKRERTQRCPRTRAWMISCFTTAIAFCRLCGLLLISLLLGQMLIYPATGLKQKKPYSLYISLLYISEKEDLIVEGSRATRLGALFARSGLFLHMTRMCLGYYVVRTIARLKVEVHVSSIDK